MANGYITERGNFYFIVLTTSTDDFSSFELKYYKENISINNKMKMVFIVIKQKQNRQKTKYWQCKTKYGNKNIYKLKEYDNLGKLLN